MIPVELDTVTKQWGDAVAVQAISFRAEPGELLALLGPSGCGKSTSLRLIAGLDTVTSGHIRIGDQDVTLKSPADRSVAMVFQSYALFPHLSVRDNILFGLSVRKIPSAECKRRLDHASELLGLGALLDRKPSQLSGGQQQRVALGRAIVAERPVCLMDEPLSNLDAQLRTEMRREIRALQQRLGMTMVYVTHDQVEAMTMADRIVLMNGGRVEQAGSPDELYERPATLFAARFIGTPPMNILLFDELGEAGGWLAPHRPAAIPASATSIGVRPESVRIVAEGIPARVCAVEYLGAESHIETMVAETTFIVRHPGRANIVAGELVHLSWDANATYWFDLSSGFRIS